jgi:hypothetical protein
MINQKPLLRPSGTTLIHHPCICPDASKNKAQLLKELNQEKFKNELLQRLVTYYYYSKNNFMIFVFLGKFVNMNNI